MAENVTATAKKGGYTGSGLGLLGHSILWSFLIVITLFIGTPWVIASAIRYIFKNTTVDGRKLTFDGNWNMISPMLATSRSSSTRGCATAATASIIPAIYAKLLFITILVFSFCDKDSAKKRGNEQKKELITNKSQIAFERFGRTDRSSHRRSLFPPCNH